MPFPQAEKLLSMRVCHIRHTLFFIFLYGRLLLHFHDAVSVGCGLHALQSFALAVVTLRAFCTVAHARVCGIIVFVQFLVKILTL